MEKTVVYRLGGFEKAAIMVVVLIMIAATLWWMKPGEATAAQRWAIPPEVEIVGVSVGVLMIDRKSGNVWLYYGLQVGMEKMKAIGKIGSPGAPLVK